MRKTKKRAKTGTALARIGIWATVWWGVSCFYLVLLVWAGKDNYVALSGRNGSASSLSIWQSAVSDAYHDSAFLPALLLVIIAVWIVGGMVWLRELKRQKISYKAAFKDLFLTIR